MSDGASCTQAALLFPLKAGMAPFRSATSVYRVQEEVDGDPPPSALLRGRRRSSMSDISKFLQQHTLKVSPGGGGGGGGGGAGSLPQSPCASRRSASPASRGGSIGDLMNMKRYGGAEAAAAWQLRAETAVAREVPLATVVGARRRPPDPEAAAAPGGGAMSCSQRAEKFARLLRQQRDSADVYLPTVSTLNNVYH
ncbi:uncharacterized protein LOC134537790 [Bacillus rossius redtenbacheri]|uniref:uncharacterized protein LOC134537790 n=1 Tax=Bacillus rossius redtenbacheri TaxID=93214 RepID=UPI002FDC9AAA